MAENFTEMCCDVTTALNPHQIQTITIVYIAFLTPSVIGSSSVLVVSLLRWRNLQEQGQLLVQLALADLLASSVLLTITSTNFYSSKHTADLCLYGLPLALVFYCLSFMLVNSYALKCKNVFNGWRTRPADSEDTQRSGTKEKAVYALMWLFFIGVYLLYAFIIIQPSETRNKMPNTCESCIPFSHVKYDSCASNDFQHQTPFYFFLFFVAVEVILSCTMIYHDVWRRQQREQQQHQSLFPVEGDGQSRRRFKHVKYTARKMVLVIIVCWLPALLLFILIWTHIPQHRLFPLYLIQAATVSLQGFLNSMVYAWKRPNFTQAVLGERTPLITYNHASFFEESLKASV